MNASSCDCGDEEGSGFAIPVPFNFILIVLLVTLSAGFSGLTLGLLSLDKIGLQIVIGGDDEKLARYARAILPVRENGNLLLCTLLLGNVAVNALLAILMADLTSGVVGFLISTVVIVIFGEIIPQASCSRHALLIGYYTLYVTKFFIVLFYWAAFPLGYILDMALGDDLGTIYLPFTKFFMFLLIIFAYFVGTIHTKGELSTLLELHVKHGAVDVESGNMLHGALKFREMTVQEIMTPAEEVFMIPLSANLDVKLVQSIFRAGYSRIPVFDKDRNDVVGVLLSKDLLLVDPKEEIPIRNFMTVFGRQPVIVWPDQKLGEILNIFSVTHRHLCVVRDVNNSGVGDPFYEMKGIVTMEDIVEEILGQEIGDETDALDEEMEEKQKDRDLAMLALISGKSLNEKLSSDEIQAISSHLTNNLPEFMTICNVASKGRVADPESLQSILSGALVVSGRRQSTEEMIDQKKPVPEDVLFRRNEASKKCILILSGKIIIYAGKDQFRSEMGPWSLIGVDALALPDDQFVPDFSAFILTESIRFLVLTKGDLLVEKKRKKSNPGQRKARGESGDSALESEDGTPVRSPKPVGKVWGPKSPPPTQLAIEHSTIVGAPAPEATGTAGDVELSNILSFDRHNNGGAAASNGSDGGTIIDPNGGVDVAVPNGHYSAVAVDERDYGVDTV